jgi:hypothetical protein
MDNSTSSVNRPIKKKIEIKTISFFMKKLIVLGKNISTHDRKGNLTEQIYLFGDTCTDKYVYERTTFDSVKKTIHLVSSKLIPKNLEIITYDSLKRRSKVFDYEINYKRKKIDTVLTGITTTFYECADKVKKVVSERFITKYLKPDYLQTYNASDGGSYRAFLYKKN